jgi:hypothetical protein
VETVKAGGELRELLSTMHCSLFTTLFMFFFFRASVYCVYKHSLQLGTKNNLKLLLVVLRFNRRWLSHPRGGARRRGDPRLISGSFVFVNKGVAT